MDLLLLLYSIKRFVPAAHFTVLELAGCPSYRPPSPLSITVRVYFKEHISKSLALRDFVLPSKSFVVSRSGER